jgi:hypothetical protein
MENTINTVNISLSEYNNLNKSLQEKTELLAQTRANLNLLQTQEKENQIIVVETRERDSWTGSTRVKSSLTLDINDPLVSTKLLDIISKVDNSELVNQVQRKEDDLKQAQNVITQLGVNAQEKNLREIENESKLRHAKRIEAEAKADEIRKLKKEYEDQILDLKVDKETLQKALKELKLNKTSEQLELARQEELADMRDKINALEKFKISVDLLQNKPIKLRTFISNSKLAYSFSAARPWLNNLWRNTGNALEKSEAFAKVMNSIGVLPKKDKNCCKNGWVPTPYGYDISYITSTAGNSRW